MKKILLIIFMLITKISSASIVFNFTGKHLVQKNILGKLYLKDNYIFGESIDTNKFQKLTYTSSTQNFTLAKGELVSLYAKLSIDGRVLNQAGNYHMYITGNNDKFLGTREDGTWKSENDYREGIEGKWSLDLPSFKYVCLANDRAHKASARGKFKYLSYCLNAGVSINARESHLKWTLLHSAAFNGKASIVYYLLDNGADTTLVSKRGKTALDLAYLSKNEEVIKMLEEHI